MAEFCKIPLFNLAGEKIAETLVSPEDYDRVNQYSWHTFPKDGDDHYVSGGPGNHWFLSHFIIGKPSAGCVIDHKNHIGLDHRRSNLHEITRSQNAQNKNKRPDSASQYLDVFFNKVLKKWFVQVKGQKYGGMFPEDREHEAGHLADRVIIYLFKEHASTNGLLTAAEIQNILNGRDVPQRAMKKSGLPPNVVARGDDYRVIIDFDGNHYDENFYFLEEAGQAAKDKLAEFKARKIEKFSKTPIQRNRDGIAIINVKNRKQEIVATALVDDEDYHRLAISAWNLSGGKYAVGTIDGRFDKMHKFLCEGENVCHLNDPWDYRKANLRNLTYANMLQRRPKPPGSISRYRGVGKTKRNLAKKWTWEIRKDEEHDRGYCLTEIEAAEKYDEKAREWFEYPALNFP